MMNKAICLLPMFLLACSGDVFTSQGVLPATVVAPSDEAGADVAQTNALPTSDAGTGADSQPDVQVTADAALDTYVPADCTSCPNTDNSNCDPNGGWTGNMCDCECFEGLTQQAIEHCGQNGCVCVPSKFPKNPGLSCIKSAP